MPEATTRANQGGSRRREIQDTGNLFQRAAGPIRIPERDSRRALQECHDTLAVPAAVRRPSGRAFDKDHAAGGEFGDVLLGGHALVRRVDARRDGLRGLQQAVIASE